MPKPTSQPREVRRRSTIALILSVMVAKVWPGSMTGGAAGGVRAGSTSGDLRVGVLHRREVGGARARIELGQEGVVPRLGLERRDAALGVVQVAEHDRLGGAGLGARRHHLAVADRASLLLGRDAVLVDALHAVGALLHDAAAPHRDVGVALRLETLR